MFLPEDGGPDTDFLKAVAFGDVDRAARFLRNGQKAQSKSQHDCSAIHRAVMNCHQDSQLRMVQLLIDFGADVNERHMNKTPLHWAAKSGASAVARLLLTNGADPNIAGDFEITPLHVAAASGAGAITFAKLLLENGADPDIISVCGTPLLLAASSGASTVTRLLLENGADPNRTRGGDTPLQVSAYKNNAEVAQLLLKGGATVSSQCLCNRLRVMESHSIMLFRAKLHVWAKDTVQSDTGFKCVFLQGCSRTGTLLGSLQGNTDVLHLIGRFLDIQSHIVVNRLRQAVSSIESIEWENHDERGTLPVPNQPRSDQMWDIEGEPEPMSMRESEELSDSDDTDRSWA
jgi:hypothetical protein